jgi:hypothetical protein
MLLAMKTDSSTLISTTPARKKLQVASTSQQRAQAVFLPRPSAYQS